MEHMDAVCDEYHWMWDVRLSYDVRSDPEPYVWNTLSCLFHSGLPQDGSQVIRATL